MPTFKLSILSPSGKAFDGEADSVTVPGREGNLGVLYQHAPMIAALRPGISTAKTDGQVAVFYTGEGVIEVSHGEVILLVDEAERVEKAEDASHLLRQRMDRQAAMNAGGTGGGP